MPAAAPPGEDREYLWTLNFGPQHPATHTTLRLILTLDGETVSDVRASIGYLHTGIEKNLEYRTWTQGTTFVTRADYLTPMFNEAAYCMAVERLLGIEDKLPERALIMRVLLLELNRVASHLGGIGPFGLELGATTIFLQGVRMRENVLDLFELITGLRMNHAFIRPGGVAQDLPAGGLEAIRDFLRKAPAWITDLRKLIDSSAVFIARTKGIAYLDLEGCMARGVTGPILRSTGVPWDLRRTMPYLAYDKLDFDVIVGTYGDNFDRYSVRLNEIRESIKMIRQIVEMMPPGDYRVQDRKVTPPPRARIDESMEALIHHFKIFTEGFRVPEGEVYVAIESPRGELGCYMVSDGTSKPYRLHIRAPSFVNLQALPLLLRGGTMADAVAVISSVDPVMGEVDR